MDVKTRIDVNNKRDMPEKDHWAIVTFDTYATDHGYPESGMSQEPLLHYTAFLDEKEWAAEMRELTLNHDPYRKPFVGFFVKTVKVKIETSFTVE